MAKGKYRILDEFIFTINKKTNQRELKEETLEQVLDAIAECSGGYSICRGGIITWDDQGVKLLATVVDAGEGARVFDFQPITD